MPNICRSPHPLVTQTYFGKWEAFCLLSLIQKVDKYILIQFVPLSSISSDSFSQGKDGSLCHENVTDIGRSLTEKTG